ncbi:MAG: hypothetical protein K0M49_06240 [Arenimonas sp.]|nr:hypothetical protein [Arenimonas sp.]
MTHIEEARKIVVHLGGFPETRYGEPTSDVQFVVAALAAAEERGRIEGLGRSKTDGVGVETAKVPYQNRVADAHYALFHDDPTDIPERNARAFEEATETAQAFGMTRDEAIALVDYTFSRPVGDPAKEIGAKILTAFSLGVVAGIDVMAAAEADLEKLQRPETIARIRAKRATRHGRGPLPGFDPTAITKEPTP